MNVTIHTKPMTAMTRRVRRDSSSIRRGLWINGWSLGEPLEHPARHRCGQPTTFLMRIRHPDTFDRRPRYRTCPRSWGGGRTGNLISRGWFHIGLAEERDLSEPQWRLLLAARERLDSLAPSKASASESWASREPGGSGTGTLWLCVPLAEERHESLQLGLRADTIVGGWQDRHYAWDYPKGERFRVTIEPDSADTAIARALDWLESEMRRRQLV